MRPSSRLRPQRFCSSKSVRLFLVAALVALLPTAFVWWQVRAAASQWPARFATGVGAGIAAGPAPPGGHAQKGIRGPLGAFTAGDLAVFQADSASANNTTFTLVELNPNAAGQTPSNTIPISGTGASALRTSGSATSTGYLATSSDGTLLSFDAHNSATTSGNANAITARGVGTLNAAGAFALAATYTGTSGNQARGATSLNNTNWFIADQGGLYTNGAAAASPAGNLRGIKSFGGTVYVLQQSGTGTNIVVSTVSAPAGGTLTGLPGLTNNNTAQDFYLISSGNNGALYDVLYVTTNTSATAGTILKFSLVGGSWVANGSHTTSFGGYAVAAAGSGNGALLYVTSGTGATAVNNVIKLTDTAGYNATINIITANNVTLYTAPAGTTVKGVAFAPFGAAPPDLTASASAPASGTVGTMYAYTVTVGNSGAAGAAGVKATFTLPAGVTFNSASGTNGFTCTEAGGVVTCTGGAIGSASSATITVNVTPTAAGPVNVPAGAAVVDPDSTITESNENNNASTVAVNTNVGGAPNTPPSIVAAATTTSYLSAPAAGPATISGVINDPTDPGMILGIDFTVGDAETAAAALNLTATSTNIAVVPNTIANLVISGSGASRNLKIVPAGVGYATITVTVTDAGSATASYTINYAASGASVTPSSTTFHTGTSDGSATVAVDANFMFVGDDENQGVRLYNRAHSGLPFYTLDVTAALAFTDAAHPEADIEAATLVGSRIYWITSHGNSKDGDIRVNRYRLFATDMNGSGAAATLAYVGRYDGLRTDLINWDHTNAHGKGADYYGLQASAADGIRPEAAGGTGFNIEGLVMAPGSTTTAYVCFRAPISPANNRTKALVVPVTNLSTLVSGNPSAGPATFGAPIELDLGGRGIRDIAKNSSDQYVIIAGRYDDTPDFRLYTWTGNAADAPALRGASLTGLNPEGIVEVPNSLDPAATIQLVTDGGDTILYNDGIIAKDLAQANFKKFRCDLVTLGTADVTYNASGNLPAGTYNNVTINGPSVVTLTGPATVTGCVTVNSGGVLNLGNFIISGPGCFALNAGGTLGIGDPKGITSGATASGNIQVTGGRSYDAAANYIYNGSAAQVTGNGLPATVNNLTVGNGAGVSLTNGTTVSGGLALSGGDLTTGPNTLTMAGGATSSGAADVVGNVTRTGFVAGAAFSFGNPNNTISFINQGTLPTDITVNLDKAVPTTPVPFATAIARKYTITPTGGSGYSATLRLHYQDADLNGNSEGASLNLFRFDGTNWHKEGQTANDTTNNWVEKAGVTQFSPWTLNSSVPTDARLDAFTVKAYEGGNLIEWRTAREVDNLGFTLYRDEGDGRTPVNRQLIAGSALVAGFGTALEAGSVYAFADRAAKAGAQYWLEAVDLNGNSSWYGPIAPVPAQGMLPVRTAASFISQIGAVADERVLTTTVERKAAPGPATASQVQRQADIAGKPALKMLIKQEGWYRLPLSAAVAAGFTLPPDPRWLQVYVEGRPVPLAFETDKHGQVTAINFYALGLDLAYTDARAYFLVAGIQPGPAVPQVKADGYPSTAEGFLATVERKDRTLYFSSLRNGEKENFFGAVVSHDTVEQTLTIAHLNSSSATAAQLEVALQGVTLLPHRVWVYLNGSFAGEVAFPSQAESVARFAVDSTRLREGANQVRLVAQGGPGDISLIDYLRLSYSHRYRANDDRLRFTATGGQAVTVGGFSSANIRVLDITNPDAPQELVARVQQQKDGYAVTATAAQAGERTLLAIASEKAEAPARLLPAPPSKWRDGNHAADLILISRREFIGSLAPLVKARTAEGLKVEVADVDELYNEFNFGTKSPQAIKDFLGYARRNWKAGPRYLLLVGDASYDPRDYLRLGDDDLVPTRLIDTQYMESASDDWFSDFNGDGTAEIATGRLPARTIAEANLLVRKAIAYGSAGASEEALLVADATDGFDFEMANRELLALIPTSLRASQVNRGRVDAAEAKRLLIEGIHRRQLLVNYAGHGSVNLWRGDLLTNEDAAALGNDHLPLFVMMTCLNGYFDDPALESLGEALLKAESGGAVAVWASSALTTPEAQTIINRELYRQVFAAKADAAPRLGDAILKAKAATADRDVKASWVLLGDPTLRLR